MGIRIDMWMYRACLTAIDATHYWSVRLTTQRNGYTLVTHRDWSATVQ
jgi:hypothetical protein